MANSRFSRKSKVPELLSLRFLKEIVAIYLFLIFVVYPLYYEEKYFNMGDAKWHFFRTVTYYFHTDALSWLYVPTLLTFMLIFFIWYMVDLKREGTVQFTIEAAKQGLKAAPVTDKFVLAYLILTLFSTLISPYKDYIIWGYEGWYMGLIAQIAFVVIYYFVSRFYRWDEILIIVYLAVSGIVFLLGVLNRFMIDPLQMYVNLDANYIPQFLSTLGQATWYSSYMVCMMPIGIFAYWYYDKKPVRIAAGIYTALAFMTFITQDSDSAFYSFLAFMSVLFYFSFNETKLLRRFFEVCLIALLSWRVMGWFQMVFPDRAVSLGALMTIGSQSGWMWLVIIFFAALYFLVWKAEKDGKLDIEKLRPIRKYYLIVLCAGIFLGLLYIILNSLRVLPPSLCTDNNYLYFDGWNWGNNRGLSWKVTVMSFFDSLKDDPLRALFGAGPDGFYNTVYKYHAEDLIAKFGESTILTCAHNEWMNAIINMGLFGGLAYLGIFLSGVKRFGSLTKKEPELVAIVMCIVSYMAHNFFCYQQIICTPVIFIIIGVGECLCRIGKRPIWDPD